MEITVFIIFFKGNRVSNIALREGNPRQLEQYEKGAEWLRIMKSKTYNWLDSHRI